MHSFWTQFFVCFCGYHATLSVQGLPKGPPGRPWNHKLGSNFESFFHSVPRRVSGCQIDHFGGHLGVLWGTFLVSFWWGLRSGSCYSHEHVSVCSARVFNYFYALQELSLGITSPIHLQHCWSFPEEDAFAWCFQISNYLHGSNIEYVFLSFSWAGLGHSSIPRLQTCSRDSVTNQNKIEVTYIIHMYTWLAGHHAQMDFNQSEGNLVFKIHSPKKMLLKAKW